MKKKNLRNFTPNELKIAYKGKTSKIIKVCVRRFLTKMLISFRWKIAKSVVNENNSYNEYPNAKKNFKIKNFYLKDRVKARTNIIQLDQGERLDGIDTSLNGIDARLQDLESMNARLNGMNGHEMAF